MRMVGRTDEYVCFVCPACLGAYNAIRCRALNRTRGGRDGIGAQCNSIAVAGRVTCRGHERDELLGLAGSAR